MAVSDHEGTHRRQMLRCVCLYEIYSMGATLARFSCPEQGKSGVRQNASAVRVTQQIGPIGGALGDRRGDGA